MMHMKWQTSKQHTVCCLRSAWDMALPLISRGSKTAAKFFIVSPTSLLLSSMYSLAVILIITCCVFRILCVLNLVLDQITNWDWPYQAHEPVTFYRFKKTPRRIQLSTKDNCYFPLSILSSSFTF